MNVATSIFEHDYNHAPLVFDQMTILKMRAMSSAGSSDVNCTFDLLMIKNP